MQASSASSAASPVGDFHGSSAKSAGSEGPHETVVRPEPGLARGRWEAPRLFFFAIAVVVLVLAALYFAHKLGLLRRAPRP